MPIKKSKRNLKRLLRNLVELYQMIAPLRNSLVQVMVNLHLFPPFLSQVHHLLLLLLWQVSYHQVPHLHPHLSQVVAPQHHHHLLVQVFQVILLLE